YFLLFFSIDTATSVFYTLSLHDALPIFSLKEILELLCKQLSHIGRSPARIIEEVVDRKGLGDIVVNGSARKAVFHLAAGGQKHKDRKSTRLNSSHVKISYAVFCLKKKKQ